MKKYVNILLCNLEENIYNYFIIIFWRNVAILRPDIGEDILCKRHTNSTA